MDPNVPVSQVENKPLEMSTTPPISSVPNTFPSMPQNMPVSSTPAPAQEMSTPPSPQVPEITNSPTKKNSPLLVISLILLLVATIAFGGYVLWTKYLTVPTSIPVATLGPSVVPLLNPSIVPSSSPLASPVDISTPTASSSPTASPSVN